jgi:hypothetical protein
MQRSFFCFCGVFLPLAVGAFGSRLARADSDVDKAAGPSAEAEAHIAHGLELRRQRRDAEALVEFRAAYALQKANRALAQIALAEDAIGMWVEAEDDFEVVLSSAGDAWVENRRDALGDELRVVRLHLADLDIDVVPASAEVWLNGALAHRRAATGAFRVVSGRVLVEAKVAGFETARRVLEVPPGARSRETLALAETSPPTPPPSAGEPPAPPPDRTPIPSPAVVPEAPRPGAPMSVPRILAVASFGLAGVGLVVGTVGAIGRGVSLAKYNGKSCDSGGVPRSVQCAGVANDFAHYSTAMTVGYVTAGAAALTGGVLMFAFPGQARVGVAAEGPGGFVVSAQGDF